MNLQENKGFPEFVFAVVMCGTVFLLAGAITIVLALFYRWAMGKAKSAGGTPTWVFTNDIASSAEKHHAAEIARMMAAQAKLLAQIEEMQDRLEEAESLSSVEEGVEAIIAASDGRRQHAPPAPPPGRLPRRRIRPHPTEPPGDARRVE